MMRSVNDWLAEYAESHRNPVNKLVHWICVPAIMFSVLGLLWSLPFPAAAGLPFLNWAAVVVLAALVYYFLMSPPLALGILPVMALMLGVLALMDLGGAPILAVSILIFVVAWIAQFWGHHVEGRRPSFFKDVQFLLIGPLWLLAQLYRRLRISF
jgi:uncharacterized membrane protein YGL010W